MTQDPANSASVGLKTSYTALLDDTGRDLKESYRIPDHLNYNEYVPSHFDLVYNSVLATATSAEAPEHAIETDQRNLLDGGLTSRVGNSDPQSPGADVSAPTGRKRHCDEGLSSTPRVRQMSIAVMTWLADVMDDSRRGAPGAVS